MPTTRIQELRERSGRTRAQVCADLDLSERHLQRLEKMRELPRRWVLVFSSYYGVPPELIENGDGVAA